MRYSYIHICSSLDTPKQWHQLQGTRAILLSQTFADDGTGQRWF